MQSKKKNSQKGFTLVELLIVIAIIGVLASIILISLSAARTRAKEVKVRTELKSAMTAINAARFESEKTLMEITGSGCSDCVCRDIDMRGLPDSHGCQWNWNHAMTKISESMKGGVNGLSELQRDPWNSPYAIDENEGEFPGTCILDRIKSAGPDGYLFTVDDIGFQIPHSEDFDHC